VFSLSAFENAPPGSSTSARTSLSFMQSRSAHDWSLVLAHTHSIVFEEGEVILVFGQTDRTLYIVLSGQLEVWVPGAGSEQKVAVIEAGSVFGEQAFLDGQPRSATIRAVISGELRALHWDAFLTLSEEAPALAQGILMDIGCTLSERLRAMNDLIV